MFTDLAKGPFSDGAGRGCEIILIHTFSWAPYALKLYSKRLIIY